MVVVVLLLVETIQEGGDDEDEEEDEDGGGGCGGSVERWRHRQQCLFGCHSIAAFDGIMMINLASL